MLSLDLIFLCSSNLSHCWFVLWLSSLCGWLGGSLSVSEWEWLATENNEMYKYKGGRKKKETYEVLMVKIILESYYQRPSSTKKLCAFFLEVRHVCLPARHVFDDFLLLLLTRWWYFRKNNKKKKNTLAGPAPLWRTALPLQAVAPRL